MAVEIVKMQTENLPMLRLIGKRCLCNSKDFITKWDEWLRNGWFDWLEKLGPSPENEDMYLGVTDNSGCYWIGMLFPPDTSIPDGFEYAEVPAARYAIAQLDGKKDILSFKSRKKRVSLITFQLTTLEGMDENFTDSKLARVVKPGGQIGVVIPGFFNELTEVPEYLKPYWHSDFDSYHSPAWWRNIWEKSKSININVIDAFENKEGVKIWHDFVWILDPEESKGMEVDNGRNITFLRLLATRK